MKIFYFLFLVSALIFSSGSCRTETDLNVQTNFSKQNQSAGETEKPHQTDANENIQINKASEPTPTPTISGAKETEPVYTDLLAEKCKTIESNPDEGGSYRGECKGIDGFKLEVLEGDIRQTVNVIFPNGKKSELDFWTKVSSAFSSLGEKAEWRVLKNDKGEKNYGLIIRYNASENPEKPEQTTSYLVVTKIAKDTACITDVVKPSKDQNEKARKLADESANKPCLSN